MAGWVFCLYLISIDTNNVTIGFFLIQASVVDSVIFCPSTDDKIWSTVDHNSLSKSSSYDGEQDCYDGVENCNVCDCILYIQHIS